MTKTLTQFDLSPFTSTTQYFKHWLGFNYTDGIQYMAEKGKAYWLLDLIGSYQVQHKHIRFQLWELSVNTTEHSGVITMKEDSGQPELVRQEIPFTDFPLNEIKLYLIDHVLLLPSEY